MNEDYKRRSSLLIITHKFALTGKATEEDCFLALARASSTNPQLGFLSAILLSEVIGATLFIFPGSQEKFQAAHFSSHGLSVFLFLGRGTAPFYFGQPNP